MQSTQGLVDGNLGTLKLNLVGYEPIDCHKF